VFILKELKVLCFDTLLQVFILKVVSASSDWKVGREGGKLYPTPPMFCVNAVDKGVSERIGVKAVDKGLTGGIFIGGVLA
jgi:hypothetical protein